MKTVVALYNNVTEAERTVRDLVDSGVSRDRISLVANNQGNQPGQQYVTPGETSGAAQGAGVGAGIGAALGGIGGLLVGLGALAIPGIGPVLAAGPLAAALGGIAGAGAGAIAGGATGGLVGALTDMGVTEQQAGYFAEGIRRGGVLVTVQSEDQQTGPVKDIMNRNNPVDVNERAAEWRQTGWTGFNPQGEAPTSYTDVGTQTGTVETGSRPAQSTLDRGMDQTTASMSPTQPMSGTPTRMDQGTASRNFDFYRDDFRDNFVQTYGGQGGMFEDYLPAYSYGYDLANNEMYRNQDWPTVEPEARSYWEERHPGTWDQFKNAVHYAWVRTREAL